MAQVIQVGSGRRVTPQLPRDPVRQEALPASGLARPVELARGTVAVLRAHRVAQAGERATAGEHYTDHGFVFCREDGSPLRPEYGTRHFLALAATAGLPKIVLHGLRHTHAAHLIAAGTELVVVSKRLGHSSITLTADTYVHMIPGVSRDAAERAADLVRQVTRPPARAEILAGGEQAVKVDHSNGARR